MPKRPTITFSDALYKAADILRSRRRYRTLTEFLTALVRYDAQTQKDHVFTEEWASLNGDERDRLDAGLLAMVESGKGVRGSWLIAQIGEIIDIVWSQEERPDPDSVAKELAKRNKNRGNNGKET